MNTHWYGAELQEDLVKVSTRMEIPAGTTIIKEDNQNKHGYIILDGKVRVWALSDPVVDDSSQTILLDDVEAVNLIGEISAIDGHPQSATVESVTDTILLRVSAEQILALMGRHESFRRYVVERLCSQVRLANEKIRDMRVLPSKSRIIREVLRMASSDGTEDDLLKVKDFPTHAVLAARCGVRRETVSRTIGQLLKRDLLKRDGKSIIVVDYKTLARSGSATEEDSLC